MKVDIVTPDKNIFSGEADSLVLPGADGSLGVLKDHAPLIATLKKGEVKVIDSLKKEQAFGINGGVVEVLKNKVIILAE
jgi:F-type H+-transporting ATPase subunit epsilon